MPKVVEAHNLKSRQNNFGKGQTQLPCAEKKQMHQSRDLRQSHSESVIFERRQRGGAPDAQLDPRIYPAWWGEPFQQSQQRHTDS